MPDSDPPASFFTCAIARDTSKVRLVVVVEVKVVVEVDVVVEVEAAAVSLVVRGAAAVVEAGCVEGVAGAAVAVVAAGWPMQPASTAGTITSTAAARNTARTLAAERAADDTGIRRDGRQGRPKRIPSGSWPG